jgi:cell division protein FtsI/penicillin-binding protein 2
MLAVAAIVLLLGGFGALVGKLIYIQENMRDELVTYAERQHRGMVVIPARRGSVLDRTGRVIGGSEERPSCFADLRFADQNTAKSVSKQIARILDQDEQRLTDRMTSGLGKGHVWLERKIDPTEADAIRALKIPWIGIMNEPHRKYLMGSTMAHVVGFVDADGRGLEGVEKKLDDMLAGEPGQKTTICDVRRQAIWHHPEDYVAPRDGDHIILTLDTYIQQAAEEAIADAVKKFQAESAVAVVLSPKTGEVLAMASHPTFDPNEPGKLNGKTIKPSDQAGLRQLAASRRNRVMTDPVEPGSIFKPFIVAAALAEHVTTLDENIYCHQGLYVSGRRNLHDHHPYGDLSVEMIVVKSSNIGMAILGERLKNPRLHDYVTRFGFGELTRIDLPGESRGRVIPLDKWTAYSTTSIPMGQEIAVTPIQMAAAFAALVNKGIWVRPKVVLGVVSPTGNLIEDRSKEVFSRRVMDERECELMAKRVLVNVVNQGTGRHAALPNYQVLGKTGTAQIAKKGGGGFAQDAYVSGFVGAAPARDPQLVALVMVRRPVKSKGYYGGTVAAPAVGEIFKKALPYLNVPPDIPEPLAFIAND